MCYLGRVMVSSAIIALFGVLGLLRIGKVRNAFTQVVNIGLAISALALLVAYFGISQYATYAVAFFSLLASFEATNSFSLERQQIVFFVVSGIVFFFLSATSAITLPFNITVWPVLILYLCGFYYLAIKHYKRIRSRLGILIIWLGLILAWSVNEVLSMF